MVKKVYLSTLSGKIFKSKKQAQKYEDKLIKLYNKCLERKGKKLRRYK